MSNILNAFSNVLHITLISSPNFSLFAKYGLSSTTVTLNPTFDAKWHKWYPTWPAPNTISLCSLLNTSANTLSFSLIFILAIKFFLIALSTYSKFSLSNSSNLYSFFSISFVSKLYFVISATSSPLSKFYSTFIFFVKHIFNNASKVPPAIHLALSDIL